MVVSIVPQQSPNATPSPRPIPGHNRLTGELVALVPSCSEPNVYHVTTATRCSCKGYQFRGRCRHLATVQSERGIQDGGAAALAVARAAGNWPTASIMGVETRPSLSAETKEMAAKYTSIFGSDGDD